MERYLRFKLGLAILYYAAFCIRPMLVYSQKIDNDNKTRNFNDEYVFYQGVQGKPGVDFPVLSHIPKTTFNCKHMESGYYADLDTDCQVFHICEDNKKISFLCPNGTIFQQSELICEWWFKVNCTNSPTLYEESAEQLREDNARRKLSRRVNLNNNNVRNNKNARNNDNNNNHGAVMRMEEHSSVSASQNGRNFNVNIIPQQKSASKRVYNVNPPQKQQENFNNNNNKSDNNKISLTVASNARQKPVTRKQNRRKNSNNSQKTRNEVRIQGSGDEVVQFTVQKPRVVSTTPAAPSLDGFNSEATPSVNHFSETLRQTQANTNPRVKQFQTTSPIYQEYSTSTVNYETSTLKRINSTPQPFHSSAIEENKRITDGNVFNNFNTQTFHQHNLNSNFEATTTELIPEKTDDDIQINFNYQPASSSTRQPPERQIQTLSKTELSNKESEKTQQKSAGTLSRNELLTRRLEPPSDSSAESQIPQETASFYKNSFNSLTDSSVKTTTILPSNHRETYEELKEPKYYSTKILSAISSVTPQYLTTQPLNNGRPFFGSQVGGGGTTTRAPPSSELFNLGLTGKTLPVVTSSTTPPPVTFSLPGSLFNVGSTATPVRKVEAVALSTPASLVEVEGSTARVIDHATVYGRFVTSMTTPQPPELLKTSNTYNTARPLNSISFGNEKEKERASTPSPLPLFTSSLASSTPSTSSGFYVTRKSKEEETIGSTSTLPPSQSTKSAEVLKPRPFQLPPEPSNDLQAPQQSSSSSSTNEVPSTVPSYKISSASPFTLTTTLSTLPTPTMMPSTFENIDSMINALAEMASGDYSGETPRPGLVIPPSAGPQTLHTLAVYFANALDGIAAEKESEDQEEVTEKEELSQRELEKKKLTALLTRMTMNRYNELFSDDSDETPITSLPRPANRFDPDELLEGQHSKSPVQSPKVRQLAKVFTQALSSYLDDPATFKRVLEEVRPTEPTPLLSESEREEVGLGSDDELLNFSDADSKSSFPPIFPTPPTGPQPTWGYILALNSTLGQNLLDVKNSLGADAENLQLADSQSFVSQFNKLQTETRKEVATVSSSLSEATTESELQLPNDHWTSSPGVHKLWKTAFSFDPAAINENFDEVTTESLTTTTEDDAESSEEDVPFRIKVEPHREVQYELRALPKLSLNSTQVHGILIDFMNASSEAETNRLQRILRKLNTTQDEFLEKMREIETNPLTRRLILLLISECGANATKEIKTEAVPIQELLARTAEREKSKEEVLETSSSVGGGFERNERRSDRGGGEEVKRSSSSLKEIVDGSLDDDSEDARALQLLNSLYSIASRFGK